MTGYPAVFLHDNHSWIFLSFFNSSNPKKVTVGLIKVAFFSIPSSVELLKSQVKCSIAFRNISREMLELQFKQTASSAKTWYFSGAIQCVKKKTKTKQPLEELNCFLLCGKEKNTTLWKSGKKEQGIGFLFSAHLLG